MKPETVLEQILFSTVRLECLSADGLVSWGTGCIVEDDRTPVMRDVYLVTNKHVVEGFEQVRVHSIGAGPDGGAQLGRESESIVTGDQFHYHPDSKIDVAVTKVDNIYFADPQNAVQPFWARIPTSIVATPAKLADFEPIEPVMFIGYPRGIYDSVSLLPVVRHGHAATALMGCIKVLRQAS